MSPRSPDAPGDGRSALPGQVSLRSPCELPSTGSHRRATEAAAGQQLEIDDVVPVAQILGVQAETRSAEAVLVCARTRRRALWVVHDLQNLNLPPSPRLWWPARWTTSAPVRCVTRQAGPSTVA